MEKYVLRTAIFYTTGASQNFSLGGGEDADHGAMCNLCFILKTVIKIML
jgi:hypothetical protein